MKLLILFISFLYVGLFSVGGGYAAIPLIKEQIVTQHMFLSLSDFTDLITIAEMTPGPIAVNCATFVGIHIHGVLGAVVATFGCILPSCIIVSILSWVYKKYKNLSALQSILACLRPAIVALIFGAGLSILELVIFNGNSHVVKNIDIPAITLSIAAFTVLRLGKKKNKLNPIVVMIFCGVIYTITGLII